MGAHGRQYHARDIRFRIRVTADDKDNVTFMQLHNHLSFLLILSWQTEKIFRQNTVCFLNCLKSYVNNFKHTRDWLLVNWASPSLSLNVRLCNYHLSKWHKKKKDINTHQFDQGELWLLNAVHCPVLTFADCVCSCFEKAGLLELMKRKRSMSRNKDLQHALNTQSNTYITWQKSFFLMYSFSSELLKFSSPHWSLGKKHKVM